MIIPQTTITLLPSEDPHNKSRTLIGFPTAGGGMKYVGYDNIMSNICSILNQQLPKSQEIVNQKNDNQPLTFQIDTFQQKAQIIIYIGNNLLSYKEPLFQEICTAIQRILTPPNSTSHT